MLYRVIAPPRSGKKQLLLDQVKRAYKAGLRIWVLVPEQVTAEYEREILKLCGPKSCHTVEVTNFSRLGNVVLREYGNLARKTPGELEKKLLLFQTARANADVLSSLPLRGDADALEELYGELEEFRLAGLEEADWEALSLRFSQEGKGEEKLHQLRLLLGAYSRAMKETYGDARGDEDYLSEVLQEFPFFRDSVVIVDGFWDFTAPQERILHCFLEQAAELWVSFAANPKEKDLFAKPLRAAARLLRAARERGVEVRDERLSLPEEESDLSFFRRHLMRPTAPRLGQPRGIRLAVCADPAEEAEWVASSILDLVRSGVRWHEIAVLSRSGKDSVLATVLEGHGIPYFWEEKKPLSSTPLAQTVLLALKIGLGEATEEELRRFLLSGVFRCEPEDRYRMEKYVATWSLTGAAFLRGPLTKNPEGYQEMRDRDQRELDRINRARQRLALPLKALGMAVVQGKNEEKVSAVVSFLQEIGTEESVLKEIQREKEKENYHRAGTLVRTWNSLLESLSALARCLGEKTSDGEGFCTLVRLAFAAPLAGAIPSGQDRILLGSAAFSRPVGCRYGFVLGLNAGVFPQEEKKGGVLTPAEREALQELGYGLESGEQLQNREFFYFYLALSFAGEGVFLSYCKGESATDAATPGLFIQRFRALFPEAKAEEFSSRRSLPRTREAVFSYWMKQLSHGGEGMDWLSEEFFRTDGARALRGSAAAAFLREGHALKRESLFGEGNLSTSFSKLENYIKCPYSYFLRYRLDARESKKASFGANTAGSFIHGILERVLREASLEGRDLREIAEEELKNRVEKACKGYLEEMLPPLESASLRRLIRRLKQSALLILKNLQEEFSHSKFRPVAFELGMSELEEGWFIPLSDGRRLYLEGSIDRVDCYREEDGTNWVRVVDYKTGSHDFSLEDVANGLDLQMLLYLFALWDRGLPQGGTSVAVSPAGVLYLNGMEECRSAKDFDELKKMEQNPYSALSRVGLLVDEERILAAQDPEGRGAYIPVSLSGGKSKSGKKSLMSLERLGRLKRRVEADLTALAEEMRQGHIEALPLCKEEGKGPCVYCPYRSVCKKDSKARRSFLRISEEDWPTEEEMTKGECEEWKN